jgi:hypothetical protein
VFAEIRMIQYLARLLECVQPVCNHDSIKQERRAEVVELAGCQSYVGDVYVRTVVGHESKNAREEFRWQYYRTLRGGLSHGLKIMGLGS